MLYYLPYILFKVFSG